MSSRVRVKLHQDNVDKFVGDVSVQFAQLFGADVRQNARSLLRQAKRITPAEANPEQRERYREYVARRRAAQRQVRRGQLAELPKTLRHPPAKAWVYDRRLKRFVPLLPQKTGDPGSPPLLHSKNRYLRRLIKFDVTRRRFGRSHIVSNVVIGPAIIATKSEAETLRILEYGRRGGDKGNPFMRPAFAKSLKRIDGMLQRAAARARSRARKI